jgi:hypothetical protein
MHIRNLTDYLLRITNMIKLLIGGIALLSLSACASVELEDPNQPKVAVEREYVVGSLIPQKKNKRSASDVKTVSSDDLIVPRAGTPTDPLGRK